ncbi:type III-B CRISPR module RAMP protein Cmr1 [Conchiformibius kuhniae]|nr:type III-B CRISPR module RAMP protein Cmr1 [Conchiformibius kuhniae]
MPVRAAAIRGQLRFWWRLLAKYKWKLQEQEQEQEQEKALRKAEFALWGGMDGNGQAGLVFLKVSDVTSPKVISYFKEWRKNKSERIKHQNKNDKLSACSYVLFAMDNVDEEEKTKLIDEGSQWTLQWRFDETRITDEQKHQVHETLRWWANFGGIGARTRRGCGAFEASECSLDEIIKPLTEKDVEAAGCRLVRQADTSSKPVESWKKAVAKLRDFRQAEEIGRNKGDNPPIPGRSRWPEPDALRRLSGEFSKEPGHWHEPEHTAGNLFPRGLFGMPIIITFKDAGDPGKNIQLLPKPDPKSPAKERMSSPLIIRPMRNADGQWQAGALLLPYKHLLSMKAEVKGGELCGSHTVDIWQNGKDADIRPLRENGGGNPGDPGDPLSVFLNFFQKG